MFIIAILLFLAGILTFGFAITAQQGLLFVLGILLVSAALALPMHFGGTAKGPGRS